MNITFIIVGIACVLEAWLYLSKFWFHKILLSTFGLGLVFTGVFHHAPIIEGVTFNSSEDKLHSIMTKKGRWK